LAELHGNTNLEICRKCGKQFLRDFDVCSYYNNKHKTGRQCSKCSNDLYDSIINFGENLPEKEITSGFEHSNKADLCLCMGSSLRVTPAAKMPEIVGKKKKNLVIVKYLKNSIGWSCKFDNSCHV